MVRWLSRLRVVQRLERWIQSLHPYVILVVMVVPFIVAELAKVFAVYWMAEGHFRSGMTIFIGAYVVSIFVCERILHAGKAQLLTIPWFAWIYNWIMALRDGILNWFRRTAIWRMAVLAEEQCPPRDPAHYRQGSYAVRLSPQTTRGAPCADRRAPLNPA